MLDIRPSGSLAALVLASCLVSACGSSKDSADASVGSGAQTSGTGGEATTSTTGPSGSGGSTGAGGATDAHVQAAIDTAAKSEACMAITPFYWEIGDVDAVIVGGAEGDGSVTASSTMKIASGTKWIFGAYVVEQNKDDPSMIDVDAMTMRSGYTSFDNCGSTKTVAGCLATGTNGVLSADEVGKFDYGGGHFQKYAVDLGLGPDTTKKLGTDLDTALGGGLGIAFWTPLPAAGIEMAPTQYASFLRRILAGDLAIGSHLGGEAVCTLPGSCPGAVSSPVPEAWHYSYGHWVEDDPTTGDGSFSSPGLFGFYPWIGPTKKIYGLLARYDPANSLKPAETSSYWMSVLCGREIRTAFRTGRGPHS